jgi:hypothetical protein
VLSVFDWVMARNTLSTRVSSSPERSIGSMVLAKVGALSCIATWSISARFRVMPSLIAGR